MTTNESMIEDARPSDTMLSGELRSPAAKSMEAGT
jgi:hypothetical protein